MKRNLILLAGFCFIAIVLISGCTTTNTVTAPPSTGQIVGTVQLEEMDCTASVSSAGVNVQILGTEISAVSDSSGNFTLMGVPAGYYSISFSKSDFCEYIASQIEFVGGGTLLFNTDYPAIALGRIPNWNTTLAIPTITETYNPSISPDTDFHITFIPGTSHELDSTGKDHFSVYGHGLCTLIGKDPNINYQDSNTYISYENGGWPTFEGNKVNSGDTVYMVVYPVSCGGGGITYYDYETETTKTILTGLGPPSNTVKFVLP